MSDWIVWVPSALLGLVVVALAVAVVRLSRRVESLVEDVSTGSTTDVSKPASRHVVTEVVSTSSTTEDPRIEGPLFADLVLRESVVRGASFLHGVRRALAPETRNRIRFRMRQEVKRSRKQRRVDLRAAKRHLADQQRSKIDEDAA